MPGKRITEQQIRLYMQFKQEGKSQEIAAAKAGFCERSARNVESRDFKTAQQIRFYRTRMDPFEEVWESELIPLLRERPLLQATTLMEDLQERFPGKYPDKLLRTLQRRVQKWRALDGPEKEIIFRQDQQPGRQGISDFTNANKLDVTIRGKVFPRLLYHFRLSYSGWEHAEVVLGGESFTAVSEGLQNALWHAGGVPKTHRTDSLSAAYKNCSDKSKEEFTQSYQELCEYYGMEPTRNNKGIARENGSIESPNGHLKTKIDQALIIRGSRDFDSINEYRQFIRVVIKKRNRKTYDAWQEEKKYLSALPERRTCDFTKIHSKVTSFSTMTVKSVIYSVPSRLIGQILSVHLYDDRLECFVGNNLVITLPRIRKNKQHMRWINYRHVIPSLVRKPQAFRNYIYKDHLFPTGAFYHAWEKLDKELDGRKACSEYVKILYEASKDKREPIVNTYLESCICKGRIPKSEEVRALFSKKRIDICPAIMVRHASLDDYNELLTGEV